MRTCCKLSLAMRRGYSPIGALCACQSSRKQRVTRLRLLTILSFEDRKKQPLKKRPPKLRKPDLVLWNNRAVYPAEILTTDSPGYKQAWCPAPAGRSRRNGFFPERTHTGGGNGCAVDGFARKYAYRNAVFRQNGKQRVVVSRGHGVERLFPDKALRDAAGGRDARCKKRCVQPGVRLRRLGRSLKK